MTHASLLHSFWQIQQVRLSTGLEFSSFKEDSTQDFLPPRTAADFWMSLLGFKNWSRCSCFKELALAWLSSCCLQSDNWLKHFLQCLHAYGFSPVWVRSCCLQFDDRLKDFLQCLHAYGFSPVWVCSCRLQCDELLKDFLQCLHEYGFSSETSFMLLPLW